MFVPPEMLELSEDPELASRLRPALFGKSLMDCTVGGRADRTAGKIMIRLKSDCRKSIPTLIFSMSPSQKPS